MSAHSFAFAKFQEATTSATLFTNGTGVSLVVSFWDIELSNAIGSNAAGFAGQDISIQCNGAVVVSFHVLIFQNLVSNEGRNWNLRGQQFVLPNGTSITVNNSGGTTFWRTSGAIVFDAVTGS